MGLVTVFCALMTTEAGKTVVQAAVEERFVVNFKVKPENVSAHVKITLPPDRTMANCGCGGLTELKEILNTVPFPFVPPSLAVPYSVLPDKVKPASGLAPSLLLEFGPFVAVKSWSVVKPVPSVLRAKTVPLPEVPPNGVVPYRVVPNRINSAFGLGTTLYGTTPFRSEEH